MAYNEKNKKIYVLDTNVLIHDPLALFAFKKSLVGIPSNVLEELDSFKNEGTERGRNAREAIRQLDALRHYGSLGEGVTLIDGTTIKVLFLAPDAPVLPFSLRKEDNIIISIVYSLQVEGHEVIFISKDLNARIKADALGIKAEDYQASYVSEEEFYKGWIRIKVSAAQGTQNVLDAIASIKLTYPLATNEFVLIENQDNPRDYHIFRHLGDLKFKSIHLPALRWPVEARNPQQLMALDLLLDPAIQLITLLGPAGTGKTFLALLAGLYQCLVNDEYEKMLISRPVIPLGKDIGYIPGTVEEKLHSWMLPIYDNMECIMHEVNVAQHFEEMELVHGRRKGKERKKYRTSVANIPSLDGLIHQRKVSLEAITYMRGRSIPYQFILIDEAQNLNSHEIKTLITRVGEGGKIVLAGDPYQIDSPYLTFNNNGPVEVADKFKGQELFGSVFLETSERSELSKLAARLL